MIDMILRVSVSMSRVAPRSRFHYAFITLDDIDIYYDAIRYKMLLLVVPEPSMQQAAGGRRSA